MKLLAAKFGEDIKNKLFILVATGHIPDECFLQAWVVGIVFRLTKDLVLPIQVLN